TVDRQTATIDQVVRAMVGREPPQREARERPATGAQPALSIRGLVRRPRVNGVSFDVAPGEIVGVFGLVGSGRTELLEAIFGLARAEQGSVEVHGRRLVAGAPAAAIEAGVALVPEDRQRQGLF